MPTEKPSDTENWVSCDDGIHLIQINENYSHYGWVFRKIEGGWPYSVRKATEHEMAHAKARQHLRAGAAQVTAQYQPAEQHQGEPVAVLYANGSVLTKADCGDSFEICCKVETPLYTHADAGELELARKMLRSVQRREEKWALLCEGRNNQIATLRAQLAEQEHSARELLRIIGMSVQGSAAYNRAVVAFHDSLNADTEPN
ncbi:hypothetical protein GCM10009504_08000 [Pseudomonas laurentiana]|uniref:Uncharacterized protein n=1 Tax=Pseudomonas laurentiana TaxID=2364649 RepID=A0A6I5RTT1_9PSED|nr:hypothetical protein [Pseudomonas laurentiana]NES11363.1 hypothetical protein [Pseudomonas laurentiana]GGU53626.1 hypothetical protein GCM10009504_08000 [Pseudomonas laurentiana]